MMTATDRRSAPRTANVPEQHKPEEYHGIQAWGRQLGSFAHYRRVQQELAAEEGAPLDAIYKGVEGRWHTVDEIVSPDTKAIIEADIAHLKKIHGHV